MSDSRSSPQTLSPWARAYAYNPVRFSKSERLSRLLAVSPAGPPGSTAEISALDQISAPQFEQKSAILWVTDEVSVLIPSRGPLFVQSARVDVPFRVRPPWAESPSTNFSVIGGASEAVGDMLGLHGLAGAMCRIPTNRALIDMGPWWAGQASLRIRGAQKSSTVVARLTYGTTVEDFWTTTHNLWRSPVHYAHEEQVTFPPGEGLLTFSGRRYGFDSLVPVFGSEIVGYNQSVLRNTTDILVGVRAFLNTYRRLPLDEVEVARQNPHRIFVPRLGRKVPLFVEEAIDPHPGLDPLRLWATSSGLSVMDAGGHLLQYTHWPTERAFKTVDVDFGSRLETLTELRSDLTTDRAGESFLKCLSDTMNSAPGFIFEGALTQAFKTICEQYESIVSVPDPEAARVKVTLYPNKWSLKGQRSSQTGYISTRVDQGRQAAFMVSYGRLPNARELSRLESPTSSKAKTAVDRGGSR